MQQKSEITKRARPRKLYPVYDEVLALIHLNLTWFVMSLPVITLVPALGGLYAALLESTHNKPADWQRMWGGLKQFYAITLLWAAIVSLGFAILGTSLWLFQGMDGTLAILAFILTITALIVWTAINQFSLPLLLLQEERKVFLAIRNGYVICLRQPLTALKVTVTNLFITIVSILLPPLFIFISVALMAQNQTRAMHAAVKEIRKKDAARDAIKAHREREGQAEGQDDQAQIDPT